jgi:hypothetical protein
MHGNYNELETYVEAPPTGVKRIENACQFCGIRIFVDAVTE